MSDFNLQFVRDQLELLNNTSYKNSYILGQIFALNQVLAGKFETSHSGIEAVSLLDDLSFRKVLGDKATSFFTNPDNVYSSAPYQNIKCSYYGYYFASNAHLVTDGSSCHDETRIEAYHKFGKKLNQIFEQYTVLKFLQAPSEISLAVKDTRDRSLFISYLFIEQLPDGLSEDHPDSALKLKCD